MAALHCTTFFSTKPLFSELGSVPEPSPTTQKKRLSDLFYKIVRENRSEDGNNSFDSEMKEVKEQ